MKIFTQLLVVTSLSMVMHSACANVDLAMITPGLPYAEVKVDLMKKGWKPIANNRIGNSSLYAQEVFEQGMSEVVDCISMELDACTFRFAQGKQVLEIKTITRQLKIDSFRTYPSASHKR